jgi:hypothetical protein
VNRKVPASDIASLLQTINAAIFFYDRIPAKEAKDFLFLAALLQVLRDFQQEAGSKMCPKKFNRE